MIGRIAAVVQWNDVKLKGFLAWLVWGVAHLYLLVGFQNRLLVILRWLCAYLTFRRGARIIPEAADRPAMVRRYPSEGPGCDN